MLENFNTKSEMQYQRLTEDEKKRRGILGRLVGIIADFKNATRNGRKYTEELWDRTFDDPIVKEKLENRCILGELGHPVDRQETDIEKVAICLAEMPKKGSDGKLHGVFDILDTPNGRILKTLCDYGCNIGVSSRGGGDTYEDCYGQETVESSTYEFECFDAVLLPAVKAARPAYVTESLNQRKTLKVALREALECSSEDDQKVMMNTLDELNIDYSPDTDDASESVDNIDVVDEQIEAADDNGVDIVSELQEALQRQQELEDQVRSLQEKLSVCYTKETRYSDRLSKANSKVAAQETEKQELSEKLSKATQENKSLVEENRVLSEQLSNLSESVKLKDSSITELSNRLEGYKERFVTAQRDLKQAKSTTTSLDESLSKKSTEMNSLTESFTQMKESYTKQLNEAVAKNKDLENRTSVLTEQLQDLEHEHKIFTSQSNAKLEKANQLVEKYKTVAKTAVDKYISSQATRIGVSADDIKSRLTESYSFRDIDKAVEDLQQYKLNLNSLPFTTLSSKKPVKMRISESKERLLEMKDNCYQLDDDVDPALLTFTN